MPKAKKSESGTKAEKGTTKSEMPAATTTQTSEGFEKLGVFLSRTAL
jgi:hypothetical protein